MSQKPRKWLDAWGADLLVLAGAGVTLYGVALVYPPAAFILGGLALLYTGRALA